MSTPTAVAGPVEIVRAAVTALNAGDIDGYLNSLSTSCRRWVTGLPDPMGRTDVEQAVRELHACFDSLHLEAESLFGADTEVCARWLLTGTHVRDFYGVAAHGARVAVRTCEVYQVDDGLVSTVWTHGDPAELFRQLSPTGQEEGS